MQFFQKMHQNFYIYKNKFTRVKMNGKEDDGAVG